jgi:hypothetical protein
MENQIGKKVIVRSDMAGVFFGTLVAKNGLEVQLSNARKLYYWSGANTVEDLADKGVADPANCKFTITVNESTISNYAQIITCTEKAISNIENVKIWRA